MTTASSTASLLQVMPQAVQADWELIRELFTQGLSLQEISAQTGVKQGTISSRATRAAWKASASKAKEIVQIASKTNESESSSELSTHSKTARNALGRLLARSSALIEDEIPLLTGKRAIRLNQDLEALVRNAKVVFPDWTEGESSSQIRIGVLNQLHVSADSTAKERITNPKPPPIDVTPDPLLPVGGS